MDVEHLNLVLDAKLAPLQRQLARGDREVAKMRASFERTERAALSSTTAMSGGFRRANGDAARFGRTLDHTSRGVLAGSGAMRSLTRSLAFASTAFLGGAGLGAALRYTIGQAGSFQTELQTLQAVTRATGAQMRVVSVLAKKLGADITIPGASAADAAEAMTELAKGGLSLRQSMRAAKGTLQLAAAAQISNAEAAKITVSALNAFRLSGSKAVKIADLLAAAANASQGSISDMALALQQAAAQAHASGLTAHETVTALTLLAKAGIQGSDAGTSLRVMLQRFIPQGKRAAVLMRDLGLSVFDAKGEMLPLRDIIDKYHGVLTKLNPKQRAFVLQTIFGADATRAANIILAQGTREYDKSAKATGRAGEAARVAGAKTKGWEGAVQRAQNAVETLAITVGEKLLPHLTPLLNRFGKWVSSLTTSKEKQEKLNKIIDQAITKVKAFAGFLEKAAKAADKVAKAMGGWEEAFKWFLAAAIVTKLRGMLTMLGLVGGKGGILGSLTALKALGPVIGLTIAMKGIAEGDVGIVEAALSGALIGSRFGPAGIAVGAVLGPVALSGSHDLGNTGEKQQKQWMRDKIDAAYESGQITAAKRAEEYKKRGLGPVPLPVMGERGGTDATSIQADKGGGVQLPTSFKSTHETSGLAGYPAVDIMSKAGTAVRAPENGRITRVSPFNPNPAYFGQGIYFVGSASGNTYYIKHVTGAAGVGSYRRGDIIAYVAHGTQNGDHVHLGLHQGAGAANPGGAGDGTGTGTGTGAGDIVDTAIDKQLGGGKTTAKKLTPAEKLKIAVDKARTAVSPRIAESVAKLNDLAVNGLLPNALVKKLEARADHLKAALKKADTKAEVAAISKSVSGLNKSIDGAVKQMDIVAAFREKIQAAKGEVASGLQALLGDPIRQVTPAAVAKAQELAAKIQRQLTTNIYSDAARTRLQKQLEGLQQTITTGLSGALSVAERSQNQFERAWAKLGARAMKAFDAETTKGLRAIEAKFAGKTGSRELLEQLERDHDAAAAAIDQSEAQQQLAEALAGGDPQEIARAQQRLADLAFEQRRRDLEALATQEEQARDAARDAEVDAFERDRDEQRDQLDELLAGWKEQIMTGGTVAIGEIESKLGPLAAAAGGVLGVGFTDAWAEGFKELRRTWEEFLRDINQARIQVGLAPLKIDGAGSSSKGGGVGNKNLIPMAKGGEFITSGPTPMLVGEGFRREHVKVTPLGAGGLGGGEPQIIELQSDIYLDETKIGRSTRRWLLRNGELVGERGKV